MLKSLRVKFVLINMTIVMVLLGIIFGMVLYFTAQRLDVRNETMLLSLVESLGPGGPGGPGGPAENELLGRSGDSTPPEFPAHSIDDERLPVPFMHLIVMGDDIVAAHGDRYFDTEDDAYLQSVVERVLESGEESGTLPDLFLRYAREKNDIYVIDTSGDAETMRTLRHNCMIIGVLSFLLFGLGSVWLSRCAIRPVQKAWDQQRQFVADASHELKTPLTVITTNAELLQLPNLTEEKREQVSRGILTMSKQMRGLVEGMLELARADNGADNIMLEEVNLSELVCDTVLPFEAVFFERSLELACELEEGICLHCNRSYIRQVVEILLDNARKYANSDTQVCVHLHRKAEHALLEVSSHGPCLTSAQCELIFQRFYRADPARSMNGSYGLGLSIARNVVLNHRGKIWATADGDLTTIHVQLPVK